MALVSTVPTGTINGSNKTFTAPSAIIQFVTILRDGAEDFDTVTINGTSFTLTTAPLTSLYIVYYDTLVANVFNGMTVQTIENEFISYRDNLGGAGNTEFYQWINWLQEFIYPKLYAINPNDYIQNYYIKTIQNQDYYTIPSNLETVQVGGLYETKSGSTYSAINYDAQTSNFSTGQVLTGGTSGATGQIQYITDYGTTGTLILSGISGTFQDNETITSSSGSATANGTSISFSPLDVKRSETEYGSALNGYWLDQGYIYITPVPNTSKVYNFRYLPRVPRVSELSDTTIFSDKYREFVTHAMEVYWSMWRQNQSNEFLSGQRYQAALMDFLYTVKKTPRVIRLRNRTDQVYSSNFNRSHRYAPPS